MTDPTSPRESVSLQRQVLRRFRDAMDADSDISAAVAQEVSSVLEAGALEREELVRRVMEKIANAPPS